MKRHPSRQLFDWVMTGVAALCTAIALVPLFALLIYVGVQGVKRLNLDLFIKLPPAAGMTGGGIANAILGTLIVIGLATTISLPLGTLAGTYLAEFGADFNREAAIARSIRIAANILSGVPSIVAGVFAYGLLVASGLFGFSALAGSFALAVLMLPLVVRATEEALRNVPQEIRLAAATVGASPAQAIFGVLLPAALPEILTGALLAIARAAGETAPLLFTALNSSFWPQGLFEPTPTLSVLIYDFATSPFAEQQSLAAAASLVLLALVLATSILSRWVTRDRS